MLSTFLAGAGFSVGCGLNAYLPLLILALADRVGNAIELERPYSWISSPAGILLLLLILPVELIGDKIPRLDRINDILHTAIRPLAGAFGFMAVASQDGVLDVWLAAALGLAIAGAVHLWKMRSRRAVNAATAGLGNPIVSISEDTVAIVVSICAAFLPVVNVAAIPLGLAFLARSYRRMTTGESRTIRLFQPRTSR